MTGLHRLSAVEAASRALGPAQADRELPLDHVRRLRQIRTFVRTMRRNEAAVYVDEVDLHLNPKIRSDWMLCGQQKKVLTPGKNQKRYLGGALDARTDWLTWVEAERKTSDLFILLLWQL